MVHEGADSWFMESPTHFILQLTTQEGSHPIPLSDLTLPESRSEDHNQSQGWFEGVGSGLDGAAAKTNFFGRKSG